MTIYNTNPATGGSGGGGFGATVGDIIITNKDNTPEKSLELTNTEQNLDGSLYPELLAKSGYEGVGGITDLVFNNNTVNNNASDNTLAINKEDGISYIISTGTSNQGVLMKNTNNMTDISTSVILDSNFATSASNMFYSMVACFKGNDLYIFYGLANLYCRVFDTTNDTWKTNETFIASLTSHRLTECHFNSNMDVVNVFCTTDSSATQLRKTSTTDGLIFTPFFILPNSATLNNASTNRQNFINRDGNNIYYDGFYWFYNINDGIISKYDELNFSTTIVTTIVNTLTGNKYTNSVQCTKEGTFFLQIARDNSANIEILLSFDGLDTLEQRVIPQPTGTTVNPTMTLLDNNTLISIYSTFAHVNFNLSQDSFDLVANSLGSFNAMKNIFTDGNYFNITYTAGTTDDPINNYSFNMTQNANPLILPPAPSADKRYNYYVRSQT
jgi:hypothetical protein